MNENGVNGQVNNYTPLALSGAMRYVYDTLEMLIMHDYVLLGDTARNVNDSKLINGPIEVGLKQLSVTDNVKSFLKTWGFKEVEDGYETSFEGVPIKFKVIKKKYAFFKNPDTKFYEVDEFKVPNPFEKYWKARFIVS